MDRHPRACWFAAIPGAQKVKDVEDCLKNTAAPPLNSIIVLSIETQMTVGRKISEFGQHVGFRPFIPLQLGDRTCSLVASTHPTHRPPRCSMQRRSVLRVIASHIDATKKTSRSTAVTAAPAAAAAGDTPQYDAYYEGAAPAWLHARRPFPRSSSSSSNSGGGSGSDRGCFC